MSRYYRTLIQNPDNYKYLVDTYSPYAAYSFRKISSVATSSIRVRRADNSESDIGFVGRDLDIDSLLSFTGTGATDIGDIVIHYDQSGNNYHLTQSTANAQSRIVSAGVLTKRGIRAASNYDDIDDFYPSNYNVVVPNATIITVYYNDKTTNFNRIAGFKAITSPGESTFAQDSDNSLRYDGSFSAGSITSVSSYKLRFSIRTTTHVYDYINNIENINNSDTLPNISGSLNIGDPVAGGGQYFDGHLQEVLIFTSSMLTDRPDIQHNINTYYSIY